MISISVLGCGWLGLPLAQRLLNQGYLVKGSSTRQSLIVELKKSNIEPFLLLCEPHVKIDNDLFFSVDLLIITLPFKRSLVDPYYYKNQIISILSYCRSGGVKKIIFTSSTSIYDLSNGVVDETSNLSLSKQRQKVLFEVEELILNDSKIKGTVLRLAGLFGNSRQIGKFISAKKSLPGGNEPVNLVHRDDCVDVILKVIEQDCWGQIFNVVGDDHPSRKQLYINQAISLGLEPPSFTEDRDGPYKIVSNKKVKSILNYTFQYSHLF